MSTDNITNVDESIGTEERMEADETSTGLDPNVAGALSYVLGIITGLVFFVLEDENEFVRFHAAQSIVFSVAVFAVSIVFSLLGALLPILFIGDAFATGGLLTGLLGLVFGLGSLVVTLAFFVAWVYLMFRAFQGKRTKLPVVGSFAERLV
ncbi:DUF4870 domain-containing protein [Halobium palmae]|uniref:DUF4870 domain-containing protein n=1 Tax=Halobium palmae TaxID=1776492 RepID=A0ABD5RY99_9EURY